MKRFLRNKRGDDTDASHVVVKWLLLLLLFAVIVGGIVMYIIKINREIPAMTQCGGISLGGKVGECKPRSYPCSEGVVGVGCKGETPICCFDNPTTSGLDLKKTGDETDENACRRYGWKTPCQISIEYVSVDKSQVLPRDNFKFWCQSNIRAPPCLRIKTYDLVTLKEITPGAICEEYIDKDNLWSWSALGIPGMNVSCQAPQVKGDYFMECSVDPSCDSLEPKRKFSSFSVI